jgi:tetratricopeptide (TPR) repeat protein
MLSRLGLVREQVRTQLDYELGQSKVRQLEQGIEECRITVIVISPASCRDHPLAHATNLAAYATAETGTPRVVILTRGVPWDSLPLTERSQVGLDCSTEDRTAAAMAKLRGFLRLPAPVVVRPRCPYPGLDAFQASNRLFGRDQDRHEIVDRINAGLQRILLLGPSGSGKSSLIRAAVLPALSRDEYLVEVVPEQADLVAALRASLAGFRIDRLVETLDGYAKAALESPDKLQEARGQLDALVRPDPRRRVLVIDPLEAIFTDHDKAVRAAFFHMLSALWNRSWCTVVLCLQRNFKPQLLREPCSRELAGSEYLLPDLSEAGLRAAIVEPARSVEVHVEPALVERLVQEVAEDRTSSALPMLQVALQHLWGRLEHRYLTLESYEHIVRSAPDLAPGLLVDGHGHGAKRRARGLAVPLSLQADRVLQALSIGQCEIALRVLVELVHLGEGRFDTRRHRTPDQLRRPSDPPGDLDCVVRALIKGRLITADGDGAGAAGAGYLHLTHDALIHGWPRLATRIEQDRDELIKSRAIEAYKQYRAQHPGLHIPPRWLVMPALAVMTVVAWRPWSGQPAMSDCERVASGDDPGRALAICRDHTGDPDDLLWAAEAHLALGDLGAARRLGDQLLQGPRAADGHRILGNAILQAGPTSLDEAQSEAATAIAGYLRANDLHGLMRGELALSQIARNQGDFTAALAAADGALALVGSLGDARNQVAARLLRADALDSLGDVVGARDELRSAIDSATTACDRTWAYLKTSVHEMDRGRDAVAESTLGVAREASQDCHHPRATDWIHLITAWLQRRDPDLALAALDSAWSLRDTQASLLLRADLAAQGEAFSDAERYLAQADAAAMDPAWAWKVASARAELTELRGGSDADADVHYRRAIDRSIERPGCPFARAPRIPISRRRPLDGLLALYARTGRWHELLAVILELEAGDVLRSVSTRAVACQPAVTWESRAGIRNTPAGAAAVERMLAAWRSRDLVIVIAAPTLGRSVWTSAMRTRQRARQTPCSRTPTTSPPRASSGA